MSRAYSVWVVKDTGNGTISGAFTVKHELKTWLKKNQQPVFIYRCRDGHPETESPLLYRSEI
jgi:hypothetical protein